MTQAHFTASISETPLIIALTRAADSWPQSRRDAFVRDWRALEAHGAELVEFCWSGNNIGVRITHDFTAHCAAYGINARH